VCFASFASFAYSRGVQITPQQDVHSFDTKTQSCAFRRAPYHSVRSCNIAAQYLRKGRIVWTNFGKLTLPEGHHLPPNVPGQSTCDHVDSHWNAEDVHTHKDRYTKTSAMSSLKSQMPPIDDSPVRNLQSPTSPPLDSAPDDILEQIHSLQRHLNSLLAHQTQLASEVNSRRVSSASENKPMPPSPPRTSHPRLMSSTIPILDLDLEVSLPGSDASAVTSYYLNLARSLDSYSSPTLTKPSPPRIPMIIARPHRRTSVTRFWDHTLKAQTTSPARNSPATSPNHYGRANVPRSDPPTRCHLQTYGLRIAPEDHEALSSISNPILRPNVAAASSHVSLLESYEILPFQLLRPLERFPSGFRRPPLLPFSQLNSLWSCRSVSASCWVFVCRNIVSEVI
jgi:hypothetical protein